MKELTPHFVSQIVQNPMFSEIQEAEPSDLSQILETLTRMRLRLLTPAPPAVVIAKLERDPNQLQKMMLEIDGLWEMELYVRYLLEGQPPATLQ